MTDKASQRQRSPHLPITVALTVLVAAVFWNVPSHEFVAFDDDVYIWGNQQVLNGLTTDSARWAFTTFHASNWHPLTWLSLMIDSQLTNENAPTAEGEKPSARMFLLTNVLLHLANTLLLYWLLFRATGHGWRSAFVAVLFAVHPLHVESVAWAAERKDVLSTFFWMSTSLAYLGWVSRRGVGRYAVVVALFALGLLAKPMLVTLPLVLLLMDYWPLARVKDGWKSLGPLLLEKLPLLGLAAASSVVTVLAQRSSGAVGTLQAVPLGERVANAAVSYAGYIIKMVVPTKLAAFYPHPTDTLPAWQVVAAGVLFVAMCWLAVRWATSRPYFTVGWLWYVITLLPVIGLVQVGKQASADRYTYVPLIGLFLLTAWLVPELIPTRQTRKRAKEPDKTRMDLAICAAAAVIALAAAASVQTSYWADSASLFGRMLSATKENYLAHSQYGNVLLHERRTEEAIEHYRESIRIKPDFGDARFNLGVALDEVGMLREAMREYRAAAELLPKEPAVRNNMGYALMRLNDPEGAEREFMAAAALDPEDPQARNNLGAIYAQRGDFEKAYREFSIALEHDPNNPDIRANVDAARDALSKRR